MDHLFQRQIKIKRIPTLSLKLSMLYSLDTLLNSVIAGRFGSYLIPLMNAGIDRGGLYLCGRYIILSATTHAISGKNYLEMLRLSSIGTM